MQVRVAVQTAAFDQQDEVRHLRALDPLSAAGGLVTFTGYVRADTGVERMFLEHYPGMTEHSLQQLAEAAVLRFQLSGATVVHRVGWLQPGDPIVFAAALAAHRRAAFHACEFLVDALKTDVPLWKKEVRGGVEAWVEARQRDDEARERWVPGAKQTGQVK